MNSARQVIIRRERASAGRVARAIRPARASHFARASLLAVALVAIGFLLVPPRAAPGVFIWNFTPSVPLGLYQIDAASWTRGERVAVQPTGRVVDILSQARVLAPGRLLLKRVAAAEGDIVCRDGADVSVNGAVVAHARLSDSRGRSLPVWSGCDQLGAREVLLLGEIAGSFDGRYFGPTDAADIVGRISPVVLLPAGWPKRHERPRTHAMAIRTLGGTLMARRIHSEASGMP